MTSIRQCFFLAKNYFIFLSNDEIIFIYVHRLGIYPAHISSKYHISFWIKLSRVPSYITTYKNSKTKRAQEKTCFLSVLQISKHASVARCWLIVDFYLSCHKHTSKLLVALSRVSKSLLDRFLDRKTWFFVFSDFYAQCVPKGLKGACLFKVIVWLLLWCPCKVLQNQEIWILRFSWGQYDMENLMILWICF